nr:MAG TPA: putative tail fiber protein [Caudoviricetes sp.]
MATRTSYLNLIKPDYTDAADIADINVNMDTLDTTIQGLDETGSKSLTAHNNATDAHRAMQATVDDTLVPTADLNTIRNLLSNLGNRIKAATGASGWKGNPATTLAAMATLASNLSSGSDVTWSGTKFTNAKLGISGVIDINGYVSFGPNFGGLIIQWGNYWTGDWTAGEAHFYAPLPISYSSASYNVVAVVGGNGPNSQITNFAFNPSGLSKIEITFSATLSATEYPFYYISIGK